MTIMHLNNTTPHLFPAGVEELLRQLDGVGFFDDAMLVGSWVMPLYRELFGMSYALRTLDTAPGSDVQKTVLSDVGS